MKRSLEISEDSIGSVAIFSLHFATKRQQLFEVFIIQKHVCFRSLESKLESLKGGENDKRDGCDVDNVDNGSVGPKLHVASHKLERVESSTKDNTSKDGLSAGSFTHQTLPSVPVQHFETKPHTLLNVDKLAYAVYEGEGGSFKKRRGKRKRKDCGKNTKEPSMAESVLLDSVDVMSWCKESSTSNYSEVAKSSGVNYQNRNLKKSSRVEDMMKILDSIFETKCASAFRRRLDSQVCVTVSLMYN